MKKWMFALTAALLLMLACCAMAEEMEFPAYAACSGSAVNVRVNPTEKVPARGQLIKHAPVVILRESEDGSCWYCTTAFGEGYVPKKYVKILEGLTFGDFMDYCNRHPNRYRTIAELSNEELLDRYYDGEISAGQLADNWHHYLENGYFGWVFGENGDVVFNK